MRNPNDILALDALADALAARLYGRIGFGPTGEPSPQLPPGVQRFDDLRNDFLVGASLRIAGVEFTLSIQHNGSAGPSYGRDNAVPLVAYKTMVARVYPFVRRGVLGGDTLTGQRVTGELTLSIGNRVIFRTGPTRTEGARVGSVAQLDRASWDQDFTFSGGGGPTALVQTAVFVNCPLNFVVPAYYCRVGRIYAEVRLWPEQTARCRR